MMRTLDGILTCGLLFCCGKANHVDTDLSFGVLDFKNWASSLHGKNEWMCSAHGAVHI